MEIHLIGCVGNVPKLMKEVAGEDKPVVLPHPPLQLNSLSLWKNSPDKDTLVPFDKESSALLQQFFKTSKVYVSQNNIFTFSAIINLTSDFQKYL